jgi:hypothetical protein
VFVAGIVPELSVAMSTTGKVCGGATADPVMQAELRRKILAELTRTSVQDNSPSVRRISSVCIQTRVQQLHGEIFPEGRAGEKSEIFMGKISTVVLD